MSTNQYTPMEITIDDAAGPAVVCRDAGGAALCDSQPLVSWEGGGSAPASRADGDGGWTVELGPVGLVCGIRRLPAGSFGEHRFALEVRNDSAAPIKGSLLPLFTGWCGGEDKGRQASCEHLMVRLMRGCLGGVGERRFWAPSEFHRDVVAIVPSRQEGVYLAAALLLEQAGGGNEVTIAPGATAKYALHIHAGRGRRNDALHEIYRRRGGYRVDVSSYSLQEYNDPNLAWAKSLVAGWMNWAWDKENLDPISGEYRLAESLEAYRRLFGGFDAYMLWPFWPRAGVDGRFQMDHFADMPGSLEGLKAEFQRVREAGVRTILAYCHWSETDRDKSPQARTESFHALVDLACRLKADGVVMDIWSSTPREIRQMARDRGWELMPYAEADPSWADSQADLVGRIHNSAAMPYFNIKKYMLPHLPMLRVCEPGNVGKVMRRDFILSFFGGHGIEINSMFPPNHPACDEDWPVLARMLDILRTGRDNFASPHWQPFVDSEDPGVHINCWPAEGKTLYTICCADPHGRQGPLLRLPHKAAHYVDLWRYRPLEVRQEAGRDVLCYDLDGYVPGRFKGEGDYSAGCIGVFEPKMEAELDFEMLRIRLAEEKPSWQVEIWEDTVRPAGKAVRYAAKAQLDVDLHKALRRHTNHAIVVRLLDDQGQVRDVVALPAAAVRFFHVDKPRPTSRVKKSSPPQDMVRVPGGTFDYVVQHGQATWIHDWHHGDELTKSLSSAVFDPGPPSAPRPVRLRAFWMDRYPVTNAQFAEFVRDSGYKPEHGEKFLAHFVDGRPPVGREDHPVVYVSYEDAKAYAAWAHKRLPTEEEWQFAAGGADGRAWPWGNDMQPGRCNNLGGSTTPVTAHPSGASPLGAEDLVGNVWQWTASLTDCGRHLMVFLRGGSWYESPRGQWWIKGGPRKINDHLPLPLFGPAMNRLATVGFRCVKDE